MAKKAKPVCYGVRIGRRPGVYDDWDTCKQQVHGYQGASFKGFGSYAEAKLFVFGQSSSELPGSCAPMQDVTNRSKASSSNKRSFADVDDDWDGTDGARKRRRSSPEEPQESKRQSPSGKVDYFGDFFALYPSFRYDRNGDVMGEFYKLCDFFEWEKNDPEKVHAKKLHSDAIAKTFNKIYGEDVDDITVWRRLCQILQICPIPSGIERCREAVKRVHVNLVDLVDIKRTGTDTDEIVQVFPTEVALSMYTKSTGRFFRRDSPYAGGVLRYLFRHIHEPRTEEEIYGRVGWGEHGRGGPNRKVFETRRIGTRGPVQVPQSFRNPASDPPPPHEEFVNNPTLDDEMDLDDDGSGSDSDSDIVIVKDVHPRPTKSDITKAGTSKAKPEPPAPVASPRIPTQPRASQPTGISVNSGTSDLGASPSSSIQASGQKTTAGPSSTAAPGQIAPVKAPAKPSLSSHDQQGSTFQSSTDENQRRSSVPKDHHSSSCFPVIPSPRPLTPPGEKKGVVVQNDVDLNDYAECLLDDEDLANELSDSTSEPDSPNASQPSSQTEEMEDIFKIDLNDYADCLLDDEDLAKELSD